MEWKLSALLARMWKVDERAGSLRFSDELNLIAVVAVVGCTSWHDGILGGRINHLDLILGLFDCILGFLVPSSSSSSLGFLGGLCWLLFI